MVRVRNLGKLLCRGDVPAREVLARINAATPFLFQVIVDKSGRLLGTITDGDMRRALLHGVSLDDPSTVCMHKKPTTGFIGKDTDNLSKLRSIGSVKAFLPIVDGDGVVREILVPTEADTQMPPALVMAGGPGKRLGHRTQATPKPLLKVGDKPILEHVLQGLEAAAVRDIYVSVHYLADQIKEFLGRRQNCAHVQILHETEPLGTAGAIANLSSRSNGPILVVNADVLTQTNYNALIAFHERHGHDATIGTAPFEVKVPFGVITHGPDGGFGGIQEKPSWTQFVAAGIYCLAQEFIALVPSGKCMDMPELLNLGRSIGLHVGMFPIHEYWVDVGRPEDLTSADVVHRGRQP